MVFAPNIDQPHKGVTDQGGKSNVSASPGGTTSNVDGSGAALLPPLPQTADDKLPFCLSIDEEDALTHTGSANPSTPGGVHESAKTSSPTNLPVNAGAGLAAAYKLAVTHYECPNTHPQVWLMTFLFYLL